MSSIFVIVPKCKSHVGATLTAKASIDTAVVALDIARTIPSSSVYVASLNDFYTLSNQLPARTLVLTLIELLAQSQVVDSVVFFVVIPVNDLVSRIVVDEECGRNKAPNVEIPNNSPI